MSEEYKTNEQIEKEKKANEELERSVGRAVLWVVYAPYWVLGWAWRVAFWVMLPLGIVAWVGLILMWLWGLIK